MSEGYPKDWVRLDLMVSPDGEYHAIGGERENGDPLADRPFIGLERIRKRHTEAVDEWTPLSRQRPSPHVQVLFTDGELYSTGYMDPQGFFCMDINHESDPPMSPTHWMPCPTAPEEK